MYNSIMKERFLSMYTNEATQDTYRRIFVKSASTEDMLGKDLYEFSRDEIEEVLYDLNPLTPMASQTNGRIVTAYISWSIDHKISKATFNPLSAVTPVWFEQFVDKSIKIYFSKSEIEMIEDYCVNDQDALIIAATFEGLGGKESSEIRNLRKQDIDFENDTVYLVNNDIDRKTFRLSHRTMRLIKGAIEKKRYMKKNGEMEIIDNVRNYTDLVDNDYVLRSSITKTDSINSPIDKSAVFRRISSIADLYPMPHFTLKSISRSGMIYMAKRILDEKRKVNKYAQLEKEDYLRICDRYDMNNWHSLKEYCNEEWIERLYPSH